MNKPSNRSNYGASTSRDGVARLAVLASTGASGCDSAANLSIALAKRGKHVCLITTESGTHNDQTPISQSREKPLEDLLSGQKVLAEILLNGSEGIQLLHAGNSLTDFCHLEGAQQKLFIEALTQLEATFDYLIVEITGEIDKRFIQLLQAAPLILLSITPDATSLTGAFSLLRALKPHYENQPVQVVVGMVADLPAAHDTYKKLQYAASKYLQMDPQYFGYLPSERSSSYCSGQNLTGAKLHTDLIDGHHLEAIADRFCVCADATEQSTSLSNHFTGIYTKQSLPEESSESVKLVDKDITKEATLPIPHRRWNNLQKPGTGSDMYDAVRFASLLAEKEAYSRETSS